MVDPRRYGFGRFLVAGLALFALAGGAWALEKSSPQKDFAYVCNCGPKCKCNTRAATAGNCTCGAPLVKQPAAEKTAEASQKAKFACNCGPNCHCQTTSDAPGNCTCGAKLKAQQ